MTKDDSKCLSGIAILLMIALHVLAGSMYEIKSVLFPDIIVVKFAEFGKICVFIFAFISGYGLSASYKIYKEKTKSTLILFIAKRFTNFYSIFWPICVFAAIQKYLFEGEFSIYEMIQNMFGLSSSYNAAWWYVIYYEAMVAFLVPVCIYMIGLIKSKINEGKIDRSFVSALMLLSLVSVGLDTMGKTGLLCLLVFISGMAFYEYINISTIDGNMFHTSLYANINTTILFGWCALLLRIYTTGGANDSRLFMRSNDDSWSDFCFI